MSKLNLLHLSDIHFHYKRSNGAYDLDETIRDELESRVAAIVRESGPMSAILVTGDIAFSAKFDEYQIAYTWLAKIQKLASTDKIWTVPGNHDIDRAKISESRDSLRLRRVFRDKSVDSLDDELLASLDDMSDRAVLMEPLEEYNKFAANLNCPSTPFHWEHILLLNDGSELHIVGLNSSLLSDSDDSDQEERNKLFLSSFQYQKAFRRLDHVVYLAMSHHPLDWLRDAKKAEAWFDSRVRLQLFGHRHEHNVKSVSGNIRIAAGAVHPERGQPGWEPRFNFITLEVIYNDKGRALQVEIFPQVWSSIQTKFVPDLNEYHSEQLKLPNWPVDTHGGVVTKVASLEEQAIFDTILELSSPKGSNCANDNNIRVKIVNAAQRLTSRYMNLPHSLQVQLAEELGLLQPTDFSLSELEFHKTVLKRAKEQILLEKFWIAVEEVYSESTDERWVENPFVGK